MRRAQDIRMHLGYGDSLNDRNASWGKPGELGTFGVVEANGIDWVTDDGYEDNIRGRVRAAVDFLDMHPGEACVVEIRNDVGGAQVRRAHKVLIHDRRQGEFTLHTVNDTLVRIEARK